jgi:hypothetical protein
MIWVSWRQHRSQAIACLGVLAGLAIYAIVVGSSMRTAFGNDGLIGCLAHSQGTACPNAVGAFTGEFGSEVNIAFWSVALIVPGLIGVLVGAPLIARELEYGTWRLAWSQTVPRARWLTVKLALVTGGLVVLGAAMTAVITWYRAPMDRLTGRFLPNIYDFEGVVPTAYILCAFGFAVLAGLLLRRTVPAMIAAFIPWLTIRLVIEFLVRPNFEAPVTVPCSAIAGACFGHGNGGSGISAIPPATGHIGDWVLNPSAGPAGNLIAYQPADRFWPFQFIEAGIFVALTAAALGVTIWLLHRYAARTALSPAHAARPVRALRGELTAVEMRFAFVHEGLSGFAVILGEPGVHMVGHFQVHAVTQLAGYGPVQVLLHVAVGNRRPLREPVSTVHDLPLEVGWREDGVDDP